MQPELFPLPGPDGSDPCLSAPSPRPSLVGEQPVRGNHLLQKPDHFGGLVGRLGWIAAQLGDIVSSDDSAPVARSVTIVERLRSEVLVLRSDVVDQQEYIGRLHEQLQLKHRLRLPKESVADAPPLSWAENPPPSQVDPLVVVVSQQTAIRALVRHYGWAHDGPDTLVRPRYPDGPSAASSGPAPGGGAVEDLVEAPGSIAEQAAAAAAAVA